MASTEDKAEAWVRPFADFLRELQKGSTHEELSQGLQRVVAGIADTGKKGEVLLKISLAPAVKGNNQHLVVRSEVVIKAPSIERQPSLFFADRNANLVRNNPDQPEIPGLRAVPGSTDDDQEAKAR